MSKRILESIDQNHSIWILIPNVGLKEFALNPNKLTYLELFYFFAQILIKPSKNSTNTEKEKIIQISKWALIELNNKVTALQFFLREILKQEKILISRKDFKKRVYDYKSYQIFLALTEGYLNSLHSIYCGIQDFDKLMKKKFANEIEKEEWFKIEMDLRNIFHHNQSPILTIQNSMPNFVFEKLPKKPRYFNSDMKDRGHYNVELETKTLGSDIIKFLNNWAKKYIDLIDEKSTIDLITGFRANHKIIIKKKTLKDLKKIAHIA